MKKVITICGSMKVKKSMISAAKQLEMKGFTVYLPGMKELASNYDEMPENEQRSAKNELIQLHLDKIIKSDAILVVNETQKGIDGYIGANSFLEMGFAYCLKKKIYLLHAVPNQPNKEEILGLLPIVLANDINKLKL